MGEEFSTDFKSLNEIEISWSVQAYWIFTDFRGPLGVVDGWMGVRIVMCVCGVSHACTHMHTCTHTCTCMLNMINMDDSMLVAICNFYTCIHVRACACMLVHVETPPCLRCHQTSPPTCPLPRVTGSPKHQNSISPELIEIIRFCLKILYLWTLLNSYRL